MVLSYSGCGRTAHATRRAAGAKRIFLGETLCLKTKGYPPDPFPKKTELKFLLIQLILNRES